MSYEVSLDVYSGPLDFLYSLIKKHKIDIYDVPIFDITNQYINFIKENKNMDLEAVSDFLLMAANLLEIKSKFLLYQKKEEEIQEDPRADLVEKLIVYKKYKNASDYLSEKWNNSEVFYTRKKEEFYTKEEFKLNKFSLDIMIDYVFTIIQEKQKNDDLIPKTYKKPTISIEEKLVYIKEYLEKKEKIEFEELIKTGLKEEVIITFLCILELAKTNEISIEQENFYSNVKIHKKFNEEREDK